MAGVVIEKKAGNKDDGQGRKSGRTNTLNVDQIFVGPRTREIDPGGVKKLAASLATEGLNTPITVRAFADTGIGATCCLRSMSKAEQSLSATGFTLTA